MDLYEEAIRSARDNGFVHQEALAFEVAAQFYADRGFGTFADAYRRNARSCYERWGAQGKVRHMDEAHPELREEIAAPYAPTVIAETVEHLDLATVIKVSEAVSGEIVLEKLLETLMRRACEYAGAERGLLIVPRAEVLRIEAAAASHGDEVTVALPEARVTGADLPESVLRYVLRTHQSVLEHDVSAQGAFAADPYVLDHQARSVLCLPLLKQARLIGVLYLENNLAPHVFTPARVAIVRLLASEAAMSIENAHLYADLQERESRVRRLVDSNIVGIFIWNVDGRIIEANDAFLQITGHTHDDLVSGRMSWKELTPADWIDSDERRLANLQASGIAQPYEKEFFRKDGTRVAVLVGAAVYDGTQNEGVAFVVDLSERKEAEEAARVSERRYHKIQSELTHANRIAAIAQLGASTAHEINQPLSGIITNASTSLRMLDATPPDLAGARETARRTLRDGNRAADVIARLRALFSKKLLTLEPLDLNEAAREVIALSSSELQRSRVHVQAELADDLPSVTGDRVQLQQVILNLLRNASEAMDEVDDRPRRVVIRTARSEQDQVRLSVQDAGVGLDALGMDRLFEAFYTTKADGMGIGLSVSRSIIESHGGRLWATPNDGPGITVAFSIPSATDDGPIQTP
jgi:PAS domain S-box-containing protein